MIVDNKITISEKEIKSLFEMKMQVFILFFDTFYTVYHKKLSENPDFENRKLSTENKFFLNVYIPCYLFFGESPQEIFKKAQTGSFEDIEKIARLDPSVLGDSLIIKYFHKASKDEDQANFNNIIYSLKNPPKGIKTLQKIKYKLAGFIALFSEFSSYELTAPKIEKLFQALSKDLNRPELQLEESDDIYNDSISRKIRREKHFFIKCMDPDKN